ncbi:MAG: hypothetical protein QOF65_873 [Thermoleophilaceae bacterium]|nr:hypothetical protein [Thermoleophilaceae bacterium]
MWTELLAVTTPSRRELAVAFVALLLAGAALFGPQVADGGFYWDDWQNSANVHVAGDPGLFSSLDRGTLRPVFGYRPVLTVMLVVEHWALGQDKHLHLAMAVLFGVLTAWALYLLLRVSGLGRLDSALPAGLLLAFPWVDSTRMWATASFDTLAVALYLAGAALAVRALRAPPGRVAVVASLILYLLASWTYEVVTIAVLGSVALYLAVAPRRAALRRFALDACVVALALFVVVTGTSRVPQSLGTQIDHAGSLASQAFSLLARALVPVGYVPGWVGAVALVLVCAFGLWRGERRWVAVAALGALFVACGYALFVPAAPYYQPLAPGTVTRMNVLAAAGYAVLVYALVRIVVGRRPWVAAAVCVLIGVGYVVKVAHDEEGWQRSARIQARVLAAVPRASGPGTTYYTFAAPTYAAPGIPAFSLPFDLKAAVRLRDHTHRVSAYPMARSNVIECAPDLVYPTGGTYGRVHGARYGLAVFVDVPSRRVIPIRSRAECLRWRTRLGAGPP